MTDHLVKRLRAHAHWGMTEEAADRIEALTAERDARIEALTAQLTTARADYQIESDLREVEEALLKAAEAERDRLREALRGLERASTEVASCGARTGPHWLKLTVANLSARAALKGETP